MLRDEIAEEIAVWSDIVSLALLGVAFALVGPSPRRHVWGYTIYRRSLSALLLFLNAAWTVFRLVVETMHGSPGERDFLSIAVVYLAAWSWLWIRMARPSAREAKIFEVARELRWINMLRNCKASRDPSNMAKIEGASEIVLRRGVFSVPKTTCGSYWRGYKEHGDVLHPTGSPTGSQNWEVRLVEPKLHANKLDALGTSRFLDADDEHVNKAYRLFYSVVLSAVGFRDASAEEKERGQNSRQVVGGAVDGEVDFTPFLREWNASKVEAVATEVGATDMRDIGFVARRVAADAVAYILHDGFEYRTPSQVKVINKCLEEAMQKQITKWDSEREEAGDANA